AVCFMVVFFFFSSRRRHTRSKRDWSSDVCSSDLGEALPVHGEANGIFPGQSHRPDLGFPNSPMQNLPRIAPAETALLPNVRILRRSRAQRDELRRIVEKVPLHAIHAGAARRIELSNDSTARIEDVDFWRSFTRRP